MCVVVSKPPENQEWAVSWATWLKTEFGRHVVLPEPPTFCYFQASQLPNEPRIPPNHWSLGAAGGHHGVRMLGANGGWVARAKKNHFFQNCC